MTVYFISGLGADESVFQKLSLPQDWRIQHLAWLEPVPNESLSVYCARLSLGIDKNEEFILIGLSFGGIIAVELNKIVQPKLTILISSVATRNELPSIARFFAKTKLDVLVPASLLKIPNALIYWFFGAKASEEKQLVRQSIANTSSRFLKWAIRNIINWQNTQRPDHLVHIHGTNDHLLPVKNTKADIRVEGGGHLMVYDKAEEISRVLTTIIKAS